MTTSVADQATFTADLAERLRRRFTTGPSLGLADITGMDAAVIASHAATIAAEAWPVAHTALTHRPPLPSPLRAHALTDAVEQATATADPADHDGIEQVCVAVMQRRYAALIDSWVARTLHYRLPIFLASLGNRHAQQILALRTRCPRHRHPATAAPPGHACPTCVRNRALADAADAVTGTPA